MSKYHAEIITLGNSGQLTQLPPYCSLSWTGKYQLTWEYSEWRIEGGNGVVLMLPPCNGTKGAMIVWNRTNWRVFVNFVDEAHPGIEIRSGKKVKFVCDGEVWRYENTVGTLEGIP
jgi:hypothetical protein